MFLEKALERYENFVSLVKDHRDFLWVAPYDIELLWRAHLLQPVTYSKVLSSFRPLDHLFNQPEMNIF